MKSFKNPPRLVKLVMETICILLKITPDWYSSVKILGQANFLSILLNFDINNVSNETIEKLRPYMNDHDFKGYKIKKTSKACYSLFMWVKFIYDYCNLVNSNEYNN